MKKSYIIEGIIFIIFMSLLFYFGLKAFNHFFDIGKTYQVNFYDIDGIVVGSPVRMMGVDVGNVTKVTNKFDNIEIKFIIYDNQIPVPAGTLATIEFSGLAGSRSIELYPPQSDFQGRGFKLEEPIRVGDAIDIMGKLGDAMMKSVAGIFEFAKSRSQSQFSSETRALLNSTQTLEKSIVTTTDTMVSTDNKLHSKFTDMIAVGENINNFAVDFNKKADIHTIDSVLKFSKRNVVNLNRDLNNFDKNMNEVFSASKNKTDKLSKKQYSPLSFSEINNQINFLESSLCTMDNMFCAENINKIKTQTEKFKTISQEWDNAL